MLFNDPPVHLFLKYSVSAYILYIVNFIATYRLHSLIFRPVRSVHNKGQRKLTSAKDISFWGFRSIYNDLFYNDRIFLK